MFDKKIEEIKKLALLAKVNGYEEEGDVMLRFVYHANGYDDKGLTPLMWAVSKGKKNLVELFLEAGANPNLREKSETKRTSLMIAVEKGYKGIIELLQTAMGEQRLNVKLFTAAKSGDLKEVKKQLENSSVNAKDGLRSTPLIYACQYGHYDIVKYLIDRGADVNEGDFMGATPIMWASYSSSTKILKLLINSGAEVNIKDKENGCTPLMWWVTNSKGNIDAIDILVKAGANVSATDAAKVFQNGEEKVHRTARDYAFEAGYIDLAEHLDDLEADHKL